MKARACVFAPGPWGECLDLSYGQATGASCQSEKRRGRRACRVIQTTDSGATVAPDVPLPLGSARHFDQIPRTPAWLALWKQLGRESLFETYRRIVLGEPALESGWFTDVIARAKTGDDDARRQIMGCSLRTGLGLASVVYAELSALKRREMDLFDLVEEANAELDAALARFTGTAVDDFLCHIAEAIVIRLRALSNEPVQDTP